MKLPPLTNAALKEMFSPGLGDRIHAIAGPIGKAIHWPCMKGDGTTALKPGSPCDKGRQLLNAAGEKIGAILGS